MASNEYDECPANSSAGSRTDEAPDLKLIGNFFPDSIGVRFPEKPPITYRSESVARDTVCIETKGKGRIFIPISLLTELSNNGLCASKYEIVAPKVIATGGNAREFGTARIRYYQWYWSSFIQAIQPVEKHIPEYGKLKLMNGTVFQIRPTWDLIYRITVESVNADVILKKTLTAKVE